MRMRDPLNTAPLFLSRLMSLMPLGRQRRRRAGDESYTFVIGKAMLVAAACGLVGMLCLYNDGVIVFLSFEIQEDGVLRSSTRLMYQLFHKVMD